MPRRKRQSTKHILLPHSRAKVELLRRYLSVYLNILSRWPQMQEIYIFDLMCGEGVYEDGSDGSPVVIMKTIRDHYFANHRTCPKITVWLNDSGESDIEPNEQKVGRAKRFCDQIYRPPSVTVRYSEEDWRVLLSPALRIVNANPNSRSIFFVDPYGYKTIDLDRIETIVQPGNTELLLFLPAAHLYRFANLAMKKSWPGGAALRKFLLRLFGDEHPRFLSAEHFIREIRDAFRAYFGEGVFVDTFTLQADERNVYALFFFTSNALGFEKMLETKWKLDAERGHGFVLAPKPSLFDHSEIDDYAGKLLQFISAAKQRTNEELYLFGLNNGYLPTHTHKTLDLLKKKGTRLEIVSLDGQPARGYYISYKKPGRKIAVMVRQ